jgi:hypothetical protein
MMSNEFEGDMRRGFHQCTGDASGLSDESSDDEMTGIDSNGEKKRSIPDAPAFDSCSLSAPNTTGIIRDSNCVDMSDHAVTQKQEAPSRIRTANCKYPPAPTTLAEEEKIVFGFNRNDVKDLDPPTNASLESKSPQILVHVGTAGSGKDAVGILRYDEHGIARQYFINTLCNALRVDNTQFLIGPCDSVPTITRRALLAKQHTLIGTSASGPAELAYLKAKIADELRIDSVAVEILYKKHASPRDFIGAMVRYSDDNARESHVRNINGLPMKARTSEEVAKNLTSAWGFDSERVLRDSSASGEEVKNADSDSSIRVTAQEDIAGDGLSRLQNLIEADRVRRTNLDRHVEFTDSVKARNDADAKSYAARRAEREDRFRRCTLRNGSQRSFREYPEFTDGMNPHARAEALDRFGKCPIGANGRPCHSVFGKCPDAIPGPFEGHISELIRPYGGRHWPTGEDIDSLPNLEECLREPPRPLTKLPFEQECPLNREYPSFEAWKSANSNVFRAEPAAPGTYPSFPTHGSVTDSIQYGFDKAAKEFAKFCRSDDWKRLIIPSEFGAPGGRRGVEDSVVSVVSRDASCVTLNDFANQISTALRVLPFPPKEITFSMTLKA